MNIEGNESTVRKIATSEGKTRQNVKSDGERSNLRQMKRAKRTQGTSNAQSSTTDGISKEFGANKNTSVPSNENVSAPNVQSDPAAGSNVGNQLPQATASCLSQGHGSVMDCSTNSSVWPKSGHPRWPKHSRCSYTRQNDKSMGESSGLRQAKRPKTNQGTSNAQPSTTDEKGFKHYQYQYALANEATSNTYGWASWKKFLGGAPNVEAAQIPLFNNMRDQQERKVTSKTHAANLTNQSATGLFRETGEPSNVLGTHTIRGQEFFVRRDLNVSAPNNPNRIFVSGPCLHPKAKDPEEAQREEFRKYFRQFGHITELIIKNGTDAKISFRGNHDFLPDPKAAGPTKPKKERLGANQNTSVPSNKNVSAQNVQSDPPAESNVENQLSQATPSYKTLELGTHRIRAQDFLVCRELPPSSMSDTLGENLEQNMPDPSNVNVSDPKDLKQIFVSGPCLHPKIPDPISGQEGEFRKYFGQFGHITESDPAAESNIENQMPQATESISSQVQGSSTYFSTSSKDCSQSRGLGSFHKPGYLLTTANQNTSGPSHENPAPNIQSDSAAESNLGNPLPRETASSLSQSHGSVAERDWREQNEPSTSEDCMRDYAALLENNKFYQAANLEQDMTGPSNENVSAPNIRSDPTAGSNVGNLLPRETASSSSHVYESRGLASFNRSAVPKTRSAEKSNTGSTVIISGLDSQVKIKTLETFYRDFGDVTSVKILQQKDKDGKAIRNGYVTFATEMERNKVIEVGSLPYRGLSLLPKAQKRRSSQKSVRLSIPLLRPRNERNSQRLKPISNTPILSATRINVLGISVSTPEERVEAEKNLKNYFETYGPIEKILFDIANSGATVAFMDPSSVFMCLLAKKTHTICGKVCEVKRAIYPG
ncbi:hypothetical protein Ddc_14233 [Ditylenchus destructor]|nr:hypothetical protein Ddc_14233 [Ditylenchus destructor]